MFEKGTYGDRMSLLVWGGRWDSNPRSSVPQTDALGQLRYTHRIKLARLKGLEPLALCLEGRCSIRLSYRRLWKQAFRALPDGKQTKSMERVMGIEPTRPAWKAGVLPLNYTRARRWQQRQPSTASTMIAHSVRFCQVPAHNLFRFFYTVIISNIAQAPNHLPTGRCYFH